MDFGEGFEWWREGVVFNPNSNWAMFIDGGLRGTGGAGAWAIREFLSDGRTHLAGAGGYFSNTSSLTGPELESGGLWHGVRALRKLHDGNGLESSLSGLRFVSASKQFDALVQAS